LNQRDVRLEAAEILRSLIERFSDEHDAERKPFALYPHF
jgi:hypothetical protein